MIDPNDTAPGWLSRADDSEFRARIRAQSEEFNRWLASDDNPLIAMMHGRWTSTRGDTGPGWLSRMSK